MRRDRPRHLVEREGRQDVVVVGEENEVAGRELHGAVGILGDPEVLAHMNDAQARIAATPARQRFERG
jgi:hypothetical protein